MTKAVAESTDITEIFRNVVQNTTDVLRDQNTEIAVDVKLEFTSITVTKRGIPVIWGKKDESVLQIVFATRIVAHRETR